MISIFLPVKLGFSYSTILCSWLSCSGESRNGASAAASTQGWDRGDKAQGYGETEARGWHHVPPLPPMPGVLRIPPSSCESRCLRGHRQTYQQVSSAWGPPATVPVPALPPTPHRLPGPPGLGRGCAGGGAPRRGAGGRGKAGEDFWLQTLVWRVGSGCLGALTTLMGLREVMLSLLRLLVQESQRGYSPFSNTNCSPLQLACS